MKEVEIAEVKVDEEYRIGAYMRGEPDRVVVSDILGRFRIMGDQFGCEFHEQVEIKKEWDILAADYAIIITAKVKRVGLPKKQVPAEFRVTATDVPLEKAVQ